MVIWLTPIQIEMNVRSYIRSNPGLVHRLIARYFGPDSILDQNQDRIPARRVSAHGVVVLEGPIVPRRNNVRTDAPRRPRHHDRCHNPMRHAAS